MACEGKFLAMNDIIFFCIFIYLLRFYCATPNIIHSITHLKFKRVYLLTITLVEELNCLLKLHDFSTKNAEKYIYGYIFRELNVYRKISKYL